MSSTIEYVVIGEGTPLPIRIPRILVGLWQLAGGHDSEEDVVVGAKRLQGLQRMGFEAFDMADHYGPAEEVIGAYNKLDTSDPITSFTKWCPKPGPASVERAQDAVDLARRRMGQQSIDLLQYHAWKYEDRFWMHDLDHLHQLQKKGQIRHLGLTNFDLPHLQLCVASGIPVVSNQVSVSLLDNRIVSSGMGTWCQAHGVAILAYGVLLGGLLTEKWVGKPEPTATELSNWSLRKYKRFIDAAGGWTVFQNLLSTASQIATKHQVTLPAIAIRHVLDLPGVAATILGSTLSASSVMRAPELLQAFSIKLDEEDRIAIIEAQGQLQSIPGGSGDEYRQPPFLTASGDLSDHLATESDERFRKAVGARQRVEYSSGSIYEPIAGYCRANRCGEIVTVSGTTATSLPSGGLIGGNSAAAQTVAIFDIIISALKALGAELRDVTRTRIFLRNLEDCQEVIEVHGRIFGQIGIRPANTTMAGLRLIGEELKVEIEADAIVGAGGEVLRL